MNSQFPTEINHSKAEESSGSFGTMAMSATTPKHIFEDIAHAPYVRDTAPVESLYRRRMPK